MQVESYDMDAVNGCLGEMLDFFIENLSQLMPELPKGGFTQLDRLTRDRRKKEWGRICSGCGSLRTDLTTATTPKQLDQIMDSIEDYIDQLKNMAYEVRYSCKVLAQ